MAFTGASSAGNVGKDPEPPAPVRSARGRKAQQAAQARQAKKKPHVKKSDRSRDSSRNNTMDDVSDGHNHGGTSRDSVESSGRRIGPSASADEQYSTPSSPAGSPRSAYSSKNDMDDDEAAGRFGLVAGQPLDPDDAERVITESQARAADPMGERELQQSLGRSNTEFLTASRRHSNVPKRDPSFVYHAPEEQGWLPHETFEISEEDFEEAFIKADLEDVGYISGEKELVILLNDVFKGCLQKEQREDILNLFEDKSKITWDDIEDNLGLIDRRQRMGPFERVYEVLDNPGTSKMGTLAAAFVMLLIFVSSAAFLLESMPEFQEHPNGDKNESPVGVSWFATAETVCIVCFTIDYLLRLFSVWAVRTPVVSVATLVDVVGLTFKTRTFHKQDPGTKVWRFVNDPMNKIDLIAIVPFYIELLLSSGGGMAVFRVVRLVRIFRIFKMGKYNQGMQMFVSVIINSLQALKLLLFFLILIIVLFGSMMFFCEMGTWYGPDDYCEHMEEKCGVAYPKGVYLRQDVSGYVLEPSPFRNIPATFWLITITATTVGYGDLFPTSSMGKLVGSGCALTGVLALALPITIVGANFANEYSKNEKNKAKRSAKEAKKRRKQQGVTAEEELNFSDVMEKKKKVRPEEEERLALKAKEKGTGHDNKVEKANHRQIATESINVLFNECDLLPPGVSRSLLLVEVEAIERLANLKTMDLATVVNFIAAGFSIVAQLDLEGCLNNGKQLALRQEIMNVAKTHSEMLLLEQNDNGN